MAVRSAIHSLVCSMPYSDRIPKPVLGILGSDQDPLPLYPDVGSTPQKIPQISVAKPPSVTSGTYSSSDSSPTVVESDSVMSDISSDENSEAIMQKYLDDQNGKFVDLIDKNLDAVLQQRNQFEEATLWKGLVLVISRYALGSSTSTRASSVLGRATRFVSTIVPSTLDQTDQNEDPTNEETMQNQLRQMLDPLDYNTKVKLLRQLHVDLGSHEKGHDLRLRDFLHPDRQPDTLLAQLELLALLWVRLCFGGIRLVSPTVKSLYTKFKEDELLLFNHKNFERAILAMIKAMDMVDEKLQPATEAKDKDIFIGHPRSSTSGNEPTSSKFQITKESGYTRPSKIPEERGWPSFLEVAQQFASEIA